MKLTPDQKAGLLITAIVHLAVIIVLLLGGIGYSLQRENSFVLDFTKQEEKEELERQVELKQNALDQLESMIAAQRMEVRNVTVNRSTQLKDDRNTDADQLYRDAERLAKDLRDGQNRVQEDPEDLVQDPVTPSKPEPRKKETYSGPSVLSWSLDGRKATRLPIPAYRCVGAGQVTVIITVNNQGKVIDAKVDNGSSSGDGCLRAFATRAARMSLFNASTTAPARQMGTITYAFIAQ
ncbi:MAG: energy transducer TonB [Bacteroidales bacterium]|nr:energy transducer TonB [Bacteroidales bacterium]MBR1793711.1 energy transducer TonB [Bacteroidales bacterium]